MVIKLLLYFFISTFLFDIISKNKNLFRYKGKGNVPDAVNCDLLVDVRVFQVPPRNQLRDQDRTGPRNCPGGREGEQIRAVDL